mgnify:CR=1 FL=1
MSKQLSFTKYERKILPDYRQKINNAESTEDVKKFFVYTVVSLFKEILPENIAFRDDVVRFNPEMAPPYTIDKQLFSDAEFQKVWRNSDLPHMLARLADTAMNRCRRLEKHPEKTDAKIQRRYDNR